MTSTTDGPKQIQRYKIGYRTDEWGMRSSTPSAIPDPTGPLVKFDDAVQLVSGNQDTLAELEQEARLMRARMERLQAERDGIVAAIGVGGVQSLSQKKATPASVDKAQAAINSGAGGVQALSAAPANPLTISPLEEQQMFDDWCPYRGNPDPRTVWAAAIEAVNGMQLCAALHTQAEQQAAPKAAPVKACVCGEPQAPSSVHRVDGPCYVAAPQQEVSQDTMYLLRRLLSNQHTLTGPEFREELTKIVGEAYQQEAQEPALFVSAKQLADLADPSHATAGSYLPARKTRAGRFTQPLYTAPQPAPAPLSDDADRLREALQRIEGASMSMYATRSDMLEHCQDIARAALAAQGGK